MIQRRTEQREKNGEKAKEQVSISYEKEFDRMTNGHDKPSAEGNQRDLAAVEQMAR
jgi:hypothetical protein